MSDYAVVIVSVLVLLVLLLVMFWLLDDPHRNGWYDG